MGFQVSRAILLQSRVRERSGARGVDGDAGLSRSASAVVHSTGGAQLIRHRQLTVLFIRSADYMQGTHLKFDTKEQAIHFCEKQGYEFFVQEPNKSKSTPKNYAVYGALLLWSST